MSTEAPLRVLVVDDEALTRASLAASLDLIEGVKVVGQAGDIDEARSRVEALDPDAVFLDILMPGGSGLEFAREFGAGPAVVFVTAHADFAVEAFEIDAADYLTKPVRPERLREALERVERTLRRSSGRDVKEGGGTGGTTGAVDSPELPRDVLVDGKGRIARFVIRRQRRITFVPVDDVRWAEAAGNYVRLHTSAGSHLVRATLTEIAAGLDPAHFRRIHRSTVVGLAEIEDITSDGHGAWDVRLRCGTVLRMTRTYRANLLP